MAAIPDAGGARYASHGVMRALLRLTLLGGLLAAGWLLGSGISHADEDLSQPGTGLTHLVSTAAADDQYGDHFGMSLSAEPVLRGVLPRGVLPKGVLPSASVPQLPVQPPAKAGVLPPVVEAVGVSKPLTKVLTPVVRPLSGPAQHQTAILQSPAQADRPAAALPTASAGAAIAGATPIAAPARTPAVPVFTPVRNTAPTAMLCSPAAEAAVGPLPSQPAVSDFPGAPSPASPPGSTSSACMIGGAGGGTSTKNASDVAMRDVWTMGSLVQPHGLLSRETHDLPRSLSAQPSTSPD